MTFSRRLALTAAVASLAPLVLASSGPAGQLPSCDCSSVSAVATALSTVQNPGAAVSFSLTLKTTLSCARALGAGCSGELVVERPVKTPPPIGTDAEVVTPASRVVRCVGRCGVRTVRTVRVEFSSAQDLKFAERANETWLFRLRPFCHRGKEKVAGRTIRISVVFGSGGEFDRARSDLNANGVRDGDETP